MGRPEAIITSPIVFEEVGAFRGEFTAFMPDGTVVPPEPDGSPQTKEQLLATVQEGLADIGLDEGRLAWVSPGLNDVNQETGASCDTSYDTSDQRPTHFGVQLGQVALMMHDQGVHWRSWHRLFQTPAGLNVVRAETLHSSGNPNSNSLHNHLHVPNEELLGLISLIGRLR